MSIESINSVERLYTYISSYVDDYVNLVNSQYISGLPFEKPLTEFIIFKDSGKVNLKPGHNYFIDVSHNRGKNDDKEIELTVVVEDLMQTMMDDLANELSAYSSANSQDMSNQSFSLPVLTTVLSTTLDSRNFITTTNAVIALQSGCTICFDVSQNRVLAISSQFSDVIVNEEDVIYNNLAINPFSYTDGAISEGTPVNSYLNFHFESWRDINTTFAYFKVTPFSATPEYGASYLLGDNLYFNFPCTSGILQVASKNVTRHLTGGVDDSLNIL